MRIALVLAAPFPSHQGSQVFVAEQARALEETGADVTLFCYGATGEASRGETDLPTVRTSAAVTPQGLRSRPHPKKAIADLALARHLLRSARREPFDAVVAHNAEATAAALLVRRFLDAPVVYLAHTLLCHELPTYGRASAARALASAGGKLERFLAGRADAVVTLCEAASAALAPFARGPVECIPPGLVPGPEIGSDEQLGACKRHGLEPGAFVLYAGNVDGYQDLATLDAAAARIPETRVVVATHDAEGADFAHLEVLEIANPREVRTLLHACGAAVLPRRLPGGFPIKLLNYLEAGRPVLAHAGVAAGLTHAREAWLLPDTAGAEDWADALCLLLEDRGLARRLGAAGRAHLERHHAWPELAERTLGLLETLVDAGESDREAARPSMID